MRKALGVRAVRLEPQGAGFFVEGAVAKATRIPLRRVGAFSESLPIPADASHAYRPDPQATTELAPGPLSLKGYQATIIVLAITMEMG